MFPNPSLTYPIFPTYTIIYGLESNVGPTVSTNAWPSANRAIFYPFRLYVPSTAYKLFFIPGTTGVNALVDVGLYLPDGTRLWSSGATRVSGSVTIQNFVPNPFIQMDIGLYYFGVAASSTSQFGSMTSATVHSLRADGVVQMASAFPLPASAVFSTLLSNFVPLAGLRVLNIADG